MRARRMIDLDDLVLEPVFGEHDPKSPEGIGLDNVDTCGQERRVHRCDRLWTGQDQGLVAAFELGTSEIIGAQLCQLQVRAHRPVEDHDPARGRV